MRRFIFLFSAVLVVVCALSWAADVRAQCADDSEVTDFKVRDIRVKALWGLPEQLKNDLAKHRGDSYSSRKGSEYAAEVRNFMSSDPGQKNYERLISGRLKGSFKVVYQHWCAQPVETSECEQAFPNSGGGPATKCIDLEISSKIVHVDLVDTGSGVLPVPHSDFFSFLGAVPSQIAALNPGVTVNADKRLGPTIGGHLSLNLLDVKCIFGSVGTVTGEVFRSDESPAPAATIALINQKTRAVLNTTANAEGAFAIKSVPEGDYTLSSLDQSGVEQGGGELKVAACNITSLEVKLGQNPGRLPEGRGRTLPEAADDSEPGETEIVINPVGNQKSKGEDAFTLTPQRSTRLQLDAGGYKSTKEPFYETRAGLTLMRSIPLGRLRRYSLGGNYLTSNLPHGDGVFLKNSMLLGAATDISLKTGPFKVASLGARYRRSTNRFFGLNNALTELTSENALEARLLLQGLILKGFSRVAVWSEFASPGRGRGSYRRVAGVIGYEREFVIPRKEAKEFPELDIDGDGEGDCYYPYDVKVVEKIVDGQRVVEKKLPDKNEPAIGLELLLGAGRVRGDAPEYARYYGGNWPAKFLYDELGSEGLAAMPFGPQLRSVGVKQAGVLTPAGERGGTTYWHANANISIPITSWSRPLIPAEIVGRSLKKRKEYDGKVEIGEFICRDLKYVLKKKVDEGRVLLIRQRAYASLTPEQQDALAGDPTTPEQTAQQEAAKAAYEKAKNDFKPEVNKLWEDEITPVTSYIADRADIYSIKPFVMFDAAYLNSPDSVNSRVRFAAGGGLQFNVVIARFEAGYLRTIRRASGDDSGNFIVRLVFRNLF